MNSQPTSEPISATTPGASDLPAPTSQAPSPSGTGAMRGVGAMGPHAADAESSPHIDALRASAGEARQSGRRLDLMRYLRVRRVK